MAGPAQSRHERGYGYAHVKARDALLRDLVDGTPCYWCELDLFRNPESNWDKSPLAADHSDERAADGGKADRLLHLRCNSQRQDGSRDDERPAVTGIPPWEWGATPGLSPTQKPEQLGDDMDIGTTWFDWPELD